jgi:hypothetical protein
VPASVGASNDEINALPLRRYKRSQRVSAVDVAQLGAALAPTPTLTLAGDEAGRPASPVKRVASPGVSSCAVCLCEYEPDDLVRVLPCHHYFHRQCIEPW